MTMWMLWLGVAAAALVLELLTPTALVSIWFVAAALISCVLAVLGMPDWLQIFAFVAVSVLLAVLVRPAAVRALRGRVQPTNADRLVGTTAVLLSPVGKDQWGSVKVNGAVWSAAGCQEMAAGTRVRIIRIEGAKLMVVPVEGEREHV